MPNPQKPPRIMYIESKAAGLNGPARIGRDVFKDWLVYLLRGQDISENPRFQSELFRCGNAR